MSGRVVLLGTFTAALVAGGYWLGRSSSESPPASAPTTQARSASLPVVAVAPAPSLAPITKTARSADPTLAKDLVDPDPKVRRAALHEAVRDKTADVETLLTASRDPDLDVGVMATIALGDAYAAGEVPVAEMVARAQDRTQQEKVRHSAVNGLGQVPSPEAFALLSELAIRGNVSERSAAALLLRNQDADRAVPVLITVLGDSDAHVRDCARDSLKSRARGRDFGEDAGAWQAWWTSRR